MVRSLASLSIALLAVALAIGAALSPIVAALGLGIATALAVVAYFGAERTGTILLGAAMFTAPMNAVRPIQSVNIVTISDVLMLAGFALLIPALLGRRLSMPLAWQLGATLLIAMGVLACLASTSPTTSLGYFFRLIVAVILLPMMYAWWRPDGRVLRAVAYAYVAGQVVSTLDAVGHSPGSRVEGLTTHPNFFGLCGLLAVSLTFALIPAAQRRTRIALVVADLLMLVGILESGSRAALVVTVMMFVAAAAVERSAVGGTIVIGGGLLVAALSNYLLQLGGKGSAIQRLAGDATSNYSDNTRGQQLSTAFHQIAGHPITGIGFENTLAAQNIYVEVAAAAGIIGLAAYGLVLISYVRPLFAQGRNHRYAYPILAYILIGALTNSLWDRFVWAVLALAVVAVSADRRPPRVAVTNTPFRQPTQLALEEMR